MANKSLDELLGPPEKSLIVGDVFDRQLRIEAGLDVYEALACIRNWIREDRNEARGDGYRGIIGYIMNSGNSVWVYRTPTAYIARKN